MDTITYMNISTIQIQEQRISSIEIAELTGKLHKDVMRAIRTMEPAWTNTTGRNFTLSTYKDSTGRSLPCYSLDKMECLYIATKFNDEARAKIILRWEQLERAVAEGFQQAPMTKEQIMAQAVLLANEEIRLLTFKVEEQRPVVEYCEDVLRSEDCVTTTQIAKMFGMSAKALNRKLHELEIEFWQSGQWHLYAKYAKMGLTQSRTAPYFDSEGRARTAVTMVWTERGKRFVSELIRCGYDVQKALDIMRRL